MLLSTIDGTKLNVVGRVQLTLTVGNKQLLWPFLIVDLPHYLNINGIIGWDLIQCNLDLLDDIHSRKISYRPEQTVDTTFGDDPYAPSPSGNMVQPSMVNGDFKYLTEEYQYLFSNRIKLSKLDTHDIELSSNEPIRINPRRVPLFYVDKVSEMLHEYESMGVITRSKSKYCAPVVIVPKKTGDLRFCCDYRALNDITVRDSTPIPTFDEIRDSFSGPQKWMLATGPIYNF